MNLFNNSRLLIARALSGVVAVGLVTSPLIAAPKSHVKERGEILISLPLATPASAAMGTNGTGEIAIFKQKYKDSETATLTLAISALDVGNYTVEAQLKNSTLLVHLGDFTVNPANAASNTAVVLAIPATVNAALVTTLSITETATATVVLEGAATQTSVNWKFLSNVQVASPDTGMLSDGKGPKGKPVRGHVIAKSFVSDGVETKRQFLWVATGAPEETELTVNVDGVTVGTVMSTKQGKLMFQAMPDSVILRDVKLVTVTDALGAVVMQATF